MTALIIIARIVLVLLFLSFHIFNRFLWTLAFESDQPEEYNMGQFRFNLAIMIFLCFLFRQTF